MQVEIVVPEAVDDHRIGPDAAPDEARPTRLLGVEGLLAEPRLESEAEEGGAGFVLRRLHDPPVLVEGRPVAARGVDVVVHVQWQQSARGGGTVGGRWRLSHGAARDGPLVVPVEVRHPDEVEHREVGLADVRGLAGSAPAHLAVKDGASREPRHHQVDDLRAVEAGVEHVDADENLRELLVLEALDDGARVRRRSAPEVAHHEIGVAGGRVGLQVREVLVEHRRQGLRMSLRHREDDGLSPARVALDAVLAREAVVEDAPVLADERAVSLRDGELSLEGLRIDGDGVGRGEQFLELRARLLVHRAPVELTPLHLEAALGGGLDRHRLVDAVGDEVALRDRLAEPVAEGRLSLPRRSGGCRARSGRPRDRWLRAPLPPCMGSR